MSSTHALLRMRTTDSQLSTKNAKTKFKYPVLRFAEYPSNAVQNHFHAKVRKY